MPNAALTTFYAANKLVLDNYIARGWPACCFAMLYGDPVPRPTPQDPIGIHLFLGLPDNYPNLPTVRMNPPGRPIDGYQLKIARFSASTLDAPPTVDVADSAHIKSCYLNDDICTVVDSGDACSTGINNALRR